MNPIHLAITALWVFAALSIFMAAAWLAQRRSGNSGWVDVSWSLGVGASAAIAALLPLREGWPNLRQFAIAIVAMCWCLRLGFHIARRTLSGKDDPRYRNLIDQWGVDAARRMFWFLQSQAIVGALLSVSMAIAAHNPNPTLRLQDLGGLAVLLVAVIGEAIADRQLAVFRADSARRRAICNLGLWSWSRHPNYFFEWLFWLGVPILAIDFSGHYPLGWVTLGAPICMYWILVHVSGIPPLESHMLRSRGDAFREYQNRTSAFFPFPPTWTENS